MPYELNNVKSASGRNSDEGYTAQLYYNGIKIADVANYADGDDTHVDYDSPQLRKTHQPLLVKWHKANCQDDISRAFARVSDDMAVDLLHTLYENNKISKKGLVIQTGPDLSAMSKSEIKEYFFSGRYFEESDTLEIKNITFKDTIALKTIRKEHPTARVWDSSLLKYRPISEFIPA